ncbi:hypothetical protein RO3G_05499 [Lichtheimia corymbifera JMRC:FSU:9682]|uniref:TOG domain-containing protein n=1 Tax=Lichtheimia corymbifera JMRC:FSU:9682 TaxID=1263082 RepID=A0A068SA22_9FUNG|nr:hypothetical protein RO3G_05499 [Lichtheimia corymbifera JMRC:FSU:9682]
MEIYPRKPIKISSKVELDREMRRVHALFQKKETDETWQLFNAALDNIRNWVEQSNAHEYEGFGKHLKSLRDGINHALLSERTRLSGSAVELVKTLAKTMQRDYEPFHDMFHGSLLRMLARTKKVIVAQALDCLKTVIAASKLPRLIPRFSAMLTNNNKLQVTNNSTLSSAATCLELCIQNNSPEHIQPHIQSLEAAIRAGIMKPSAEVRTAVRACYKAYASKMPENATSFEEGLVDNEKKHLKPPVVRKSSSSGSLSSSVSSTSTSSSSLSHGRNSLPSMRQRTIATTRPTAGRHSVPQLGAKPRPQPSTCTSTRTPISSKHTRKPISSASSASSTSSSLLARRTPSGIPPKPSSATAALRKPIKKAVGSSVRSRVPIASSKVRQQKAELTAAAATATTTTTTTTTSTESSKERQKSELKTQQTTNTSLSEPTKENNTQSQHEEKATISTESSDKDNNKSNDAISQQHEKSSTESADVAANTTTPFSKGSSSTPLPSSSSAEPDVVPDQKPKQRTSASQVELKPRVKLELNRGGPPSHLSIGKKPWTVTGVPMRERKRKLDQGGGEENRRPVKRR